MTSVSREKIKKAVEAKYTQIARQGSSCCGTSSCCGDEAVATAQQIAKKIGYSGEDLAGLPDNANLGLGCGNPQAIAKLKEGETVLDLGSGGGIDCFLAARRVREKGRVIGVDMTAEMIAKARENARQGGFSNVEFRLGEIEHLPVPDASADVILSNCVINLSPDKVQVFREAYRVLKPGGRLAISDIVATKNLPEALQKDLAYYVGCVSGAAMIEELESILAETGFTNIRITPRDESRTLMRELAPGKHIEDYVVSALIEAVKPGE